VVRSNSVRQKCPVQAPYFRHVLPLVRGFPTLGVLCVIRHPRSIQRATSLPRRPRLPGLGATAAPRFQHSSVSRFPLPCLWSCIPSCYGGSTQEHLGLPKFLCASLPACHGLRTPADLSILANTDGLVLPSVCVKTLGVRNKRLSKLYQHFRVRGHPYGLQDSLSTLRPSCSLEVSSPLRHGRKTRYGWVANPCPARTCTLQETPSFAWRDNARRQARLKAEAKRKL
jgi:hypothetical protein